jgi:hypothetical protein
MQPHVMMHDPLSKNPLLQRHLPDVGVKPVEHVVHVFLSEQILHPLIRMLHLIHVAEYVSSP